MGWPTGEEVLKKLAADGKPVHLAFSCGKDSLCLWLRMREHGIDVRPCYRYLVPGLEFVESSLAYYEKQFGIKIVQVPNKSLYRLLVNLVFQPPEHQPIVRDSGLREIDQTDSQAEAVRACGLPVDTWTAVGTRGCDSPVRRANFTKNGPWNLKTRSVFPVYDANKDFVIKTIHGSGIMLPGEYRIFGRSFDGIDFRFLWGIRQHWPRDYERIIEMFPLAHLEIMRYEIEQRRHARAVERIRLGGNVG